MDTMDLSEAVDLALGAVIFENWLRFHFIRDHTGAPVLELPENALALIAERQPRYLPLAKMLDGQPVEFERSREAVCRFAMQQLDDLGRQKCDASGGDLALAVFESPQFQRRLQLFSVWLGIAQDMLERSFMDYDRWLELFLSWEGHAAAQA